MEDEATGGGGGGGGDSVGFKSFKRSNAAIRRKRVDHEGEDGGKREQAGGEGPAAALPKKPDVKKTAVKKASLSFDAEEIEDDGTFMSKKKKHKAKDYVDVSFHTKGDREGGTSASSYYNSGQSYSAEDIAELSKNAKSWGGAPPGSKKKEGEGDRPVRLKGLTWDADVKEDEDMADGNPLGEEGEELKVHHGMGKEPGLGEFAASRGEIPTQDEIARLKARREQARKTGVTGGGGGLSRDFIPLEGSLDEKKNENSRVVRENIEDDEDSMVQDDVLSDAKRISFGQSESDHARKRAEMAQAVVLDDDEDEEDDEMRKWEQEQIRKGRGSQGKREEAKVANKENMRGPGGASQFKTFKEVQTMLRDQLASMKEAHGEDKQRLQQAIQRVRSTEEATKSLEEHVKAAKARYTFFQEMRCYVQDVLECLDAKAIMLEEMEDDMTAARKKRAQTRRRRRVEDIHDRVQAARDQIAKAMGVTNKEDEEKDEFGRDLSIGREQRVKARLLRREKAISRRKKLTQEEVEEDSKFAEELITSEESDGEVEEYRQAMDKLRENVIASQRRLFVFDLDVEQAGELMEDVREDYSQISPVVSRLVSWRRRDIKSYRDAYVSMSLPRLLAPYVRMSILHWDPLVDGKPVESMEWVNSIFRIQEELEEDARKSSVNKLDEDEENLIPTLVKEVICPRVKEAIKFSWNPCSRASTRRAVAMVQDVLVYILELSPETARTLCEEVVLSMRTELELHTAALEVIGSGDSPDNSALALGRWSFLQCCKLVRNAGAWKQVVSAQALQALTVDTLTSKMLLPFLNEVKKVSPQLCSDLSHFLFDSYPVEWRGQIFLLPLVSFMRTLNDQ